MIFESNYNNYLPKDKGDFETVSKLKELSIEQLNEIADSLLVWLQDINWPISSAVAKELLRLEEKLMPSIVKVLQTRDEWWSRNCLRLICEEMDGEVIAILRSQLETLAQNPTELEKIEEVDVIAEELLKKITISS